MSTTVASFTESATETCKCDKCGYIYAIRERAAHGKFNDHTQAAMPTARPSCCVVTQWIFCLVCKVSVLTSYHTTPPSPNHAHSKVRSFHLIHTLYVYTALVRTGLYNQSFPLPYPKSPGTQNTTNVRHLKTSLWTWPETL